MAACERLTSLLEQEMDLIEKDSDRLQDQILYWLTVKWQHTLKCAAKQRGLNRLGMHSLPPCGISAHLAKQAIEMHMYCASLNETQWANDSWTLQDCSRERLETPPKNCFKKGPKVVEVIFDEDPSNRVWYTLWNFCYFYTENGWFETSCYADKIGCYYLDMTGVSVYYHRFEDDARNFSKTGSWKLLNSNDYCVPSSSTHPEDVDWPDSLPPDCFGRQSGPARGPAEDCEPTAGAVPTDRAESSSPVCSSTNNLDSGRSRCGPWQRSLSSPGGERDIDPRSAGPSFESSLPGGVEPVSQRSEKEGSAADSSFGAPSAEGEEEEEGLLKGPQRHCLLVTGSVNRVKCFRHRVKHHHRRKYKDITTTLQIVGDEGSSRKGQAMIIITFSSRTHRDNFKNSVTLPTGMKCKPFLMQAE
ncbi:E2 early protein [Bos taurus papillomavirus 33]|nr:E2 early protein [Bos taurus papillomavirus 33]